jgi:hypothetical protein
MGLLALAYWAVNEQLMTLLSEERKQDLIRYFAREGDTLFGLVNGISRQAQDFQDVDQQIEVERFAGKALAKPEEVLVAP